MKLQKFKQHDIVVLTEKQKKLGTWNLGRKPGTVALITYVKYLPHMREFWPDGYQYSVRYLSEDPTCGAPYGGHQLRLATVKEITEAICKGLLPEIDAHCEQCIAEDASKKKRVVKKPQTKSQQR